MRRWLACLGLVLAAAWAGPAVSLAAGPGRVVVLPLENMTGEESLYWLGEAFAIGLSDQLLAAGHEVVEPSRRREASLDLGLPQDEPVTLASSILLARRVNAHTAIMGKVRLRAGHRFEVAARLMDVDEHRQGEPVRMSGALHDLYALQERLARTLVPAREGAGADRVTPLDVLEQVPLAGFELYVKAVSQMDPDARRVLLDRALEIDPLYPAALVERARVELEEGRAHDALLWLDRIQVEAMAFPERFWLAQGDAAAANGDRGSAIDLYGRALKLRPLPAAHFRLAAALAQQGRLAEARRAVDAGLALDPLHPEGMELREALASPPAEPAGEPPSGPAA